MHADVAVIGGGSAGIAAAVGAARKGANVVLIEKYGMLGGMATTAMVHSICGLYLLRADESEPLEFANNGFPREFSELLKKAGGARGPVRMGRLDVLMHNPKAFAMAADEILKGLPNVLVLLDTQVTRARREGNRICGIEIVGKTGSDAIKSAVVLDTTGDGEVAKLAAAGYDRSPLETLQRPAYIFSIAGVASSEVSDNGRLGIARAISYGVSAGHLTEGALGAAFRAGMTPEQVMVTIDLQAPGFDPNDKERLSTAESEGREIATQLIQFLKTEITGFRQASITQLPARLGIRESRRIHGIYQLTREDILNGARFDDEVALASWPIELRETARGPRFRFPVDNRPCGIPLRCLRSKDTENLFVAGRCISSTHEAQAAIRVIGTCLATGEAAGIAAALQSESNKS